MDAMERISIGNLALILALAQCDHSMAQQIAQMPETPNTKIYQGNGTCGSGTGCHWTQSCFPRNGCPDDFLPNPLPRPCQPPYPPFYQCVPAGPCGSSCGSGPVQSRLTWWFLPTPRALREAFWFQP